MGTAILTREQLEERLAALHRASLELVQDISLESLLERIATVACEQAQARYAAVGVLGEEGELAQFITVGMSPDEVRRQAHPPRGFGLIGVLMHSEDAIRIPDINTDTRRVGFPKHHPPMDSFLGVPIRLGDQPLGQIYLTNKLDGPEFTTDDQQVIETLASYAAVAIANARLYQQLSQRDRILTQRNENLALINELASTLASSTDSDEILDKALTQLIDYLHLEAGEVYLRQDDSKNLVLAIHRSTLIDSMWNQSQYKIGEGVVGLTAKNDQPSLISLPSSDGRDLSKTILEGCFTQVACFPLTGRSGVLGVLSVATCHPQPLEETEIQFISALCYWVGTAIENVGLNLQQRRLAVLEERERIGMDLHDGIIQSIYAVGLTLEHARLLMNEDPQQAHHRIEQAVSDLNSTIRDIRAYILDLRPRQLHDENLMQGLQRLVNEFRANTLVDVRLEGPPDGLAKMPESEAVALFHICQEALANIAKHARAHHVEVALWSVAGRALLEIRDDGRGYDLAKVKQTLGHGLSNMQTRAHNAGGDIDISTGLDEGTVVLAWVPYSSDDPIPA
jgi:two-component system, NarL family, sensor histidine kinase DevS